MATNGAISPGTHRLTQLITPQQIADVVSRIAAEVTRDYRGKRPLLIGVLKGSFVFLADLIRCLDMAVEVEFITLSSYESGTHTSGRVTVIRGARMPLRGRDIIVVEDIIDTGVTLNFLLIQLKRRRPASLRVCTLLDKASRRQVDVPIDYRGFVVPDRFIVGYGLDCDQQFRHFPGLYVLHEDCEE